LKLRPVVFLSILYIVLSLVYSTLGFLNGQPHGNGSEYTIAFLIPEISGHILFAAIAIAPFLDMELVLLSAVVAVFIDMDHLLGTFTRLPFIGRPNHSILFILVAAAILVYFSGRMKADRSTQMKIAFVVPVAVLSHLSFDVLAAYDIFGGGAFTFPIFYPFSSMLIAFPLYSFVVLEAVACGLSMLGVLLVRKICSAEKSSAVGCKQVVLSLFMSGSLCHEPLLK
jgi:hypothetical protein